MVPTFLSEGRGAPGYWAIKPQNRPGFRGLWVPSSLRLLVTQPCPLPPNPAQVQLCKS